MHHDETRILARVDRALTERITPAVHQQLGDLEVSAWAVPGSGEPVPIREAAAAPFDPVQLPYRWGRAWSTWWFRLDAVMPAAAGTGPVQLEVDLGFKDDWPGNQCEGMLYGADLRPIKALNSRNRRAVLEGPPGSAVRLWVEAAANPDLMERGTEPTELGDRLTAPDDLVYELRRACFVERDQEVWGLWHDVDVLRQLAVELPVESPRRAVIVCALDDMVDQLDLHDVPGTAARARAVLARVLSAPAVASALQVTAIGHAHIDAAWLWPVRETVRKVGRTFANVDALMAQYPEFTFTATSAQQYAWLAEAHPEIHQRVRARIAEGRWFPSGGMWVESDVNLPGGEALIRQFTYGTRFFEAQYGVRSRTLWLPDSFGYSAALPQIARLMGMEGFLTQKISWSKTNRYPHSTFWWEGIDGSRILTHYPPVDCYDSMLVGEEIAAAERNFRDKGRATHQVIPFGYGDGGGGPTATMLERARRRADLEGSPRLHPGDPDSFFAAAREEYGQRAAVHRGELYLEFHRGVYTSQLEMKQGNRRAEHALRTVELVWTLVGLRGAGALDQERLDRLWERTLLLQFHDILPGSSIAWVHRDARADYRWILEQCEALIQQGLQLLADDAEQDAQPTPEQQPAFEAQTAPLALPAPPSPGMVLNVAPHERLAVLGEGDQAQLVRVPGSSLTPLAQAILDPDAAGITPVAVDVDGPDLLLDNGLVRIRIDAEGTLSSVRDLVAEREVLVAGGRGNELQLFEDVPNEFDAWDVDRHYRGTRAKRSLGAPQRIEVVEQSPLRAVVEIERTVGQQSPAVQTVMLEAGSSRVDFGVQIDWRERETLLKAAFPLAVHAREVQAEIQFGHVSRAVDENTSWEFAKFEAPAHRWLLAAEPGYGAALINDSTYGYDALPWHPGTHGQPALGTLLRLSLMRAPNWPDPRADLSRRTLRYSLLVGADPVSATRAGHELNLPLRTAAGRAEPIQLVRAHHRSVQVAAVLPAHDGSGDVIVRLYESAGSHCRTRLDLGFPVARVRVVDPLDVELEGADAAAVGPDPSTPAVGPDPSTPAAPAALRVDLRPFQILSLRLTPEETR